MIKQQPQPVLKLFSEKSHKFILNSHKVQDYCTNQFLFYDSKNARALRIL